MGNRGTRIAILIHNLSTKWGWVVNATSRLLYLWETAVEPIVGEAVWVPRPVWMGMENRKPLASTRVRTPQRPAHSGSLYRLRCPNPRIGERIILKWLNDIGWESGYWVHLTRDKSQWQALVNMVINYCIAWNVGDFITGWRTVISWSWLSWNALHVKIWS